MDGLEEVVEKIPLVAEEDWWIISRVWAVNGQIKWGGMQGGDGLVDVLKTQKQGEGACDEVG